MPPDRGYAICATPRSGSNLLCQYLSSTGVLRHPLEYFNGPARRVLTDPSYPDDPVEQVRWILTRGATPNGIYGLKLFVSNHTAVSRELDWTGVLPNLHYVHLATKGQAGPGTIMGTCP